MLLQRCAANPTSLAHQHRLSRAIGPVSAGSAVSRGSWHPTSLAAGSASGQQGQRGSVVSFAAAPIVASQAGAPPPRASKKKVKKLVDINGDVTKDLGNGMFQLKLENGVSVMAHLSGKIRQNRIKIVVGDKVTVELSPYDLTRGRITYRFKPGELERAQAGPPASS
mmetsp:Transcript_12652/g.27380  ORF Transcript_12652/g.27380 Transcript_12652/m.27380 type:complete len:167 (-) Transcript_12652:663-1163(-)